MKNFKVIISLLALLTASDALPMTGTERRAARRAQAANAATTQDLTQVTPVEVAPTTTTGRRRDRGQVAAPVTQVAPVEAAAPTGRRRDRRAGATPAQVQETTTVTEQVERGPVGTGWDFPGGITAKEGLTQKGIYMTAADIFYDQDKKSIRPGGIKTYVTMVRKAYPDLQGEALIKKTYDDAAALLAETRGENPKTQLIAAPQFYKKLMDDIRWEAQSTSVPQTPAAPGTGWDVPGGVGKEPKALPAKPKTSKALPTMPLPAREAVMQELENAKNWNDFKAITDSNIKVFYDNGQLQQKWFNVAAKIAQKFNPKMTESQMEETLIKSAEQLFLTATGKLPLTADDKDSISAAANIATWGLPL